MKVRAIKRGFYGGIYRRRGDVFDCSSPDFSSKWMEKVGKKKPTPLPSIDYEPLEIPSLAERSKDLYGP
jgi:hypothetical protein